MITLANRNGSPHPSRIPVAFSIAGSDPSGGAGLQADLKTFCAFKVYGAAAVTAVTVQNTQGVQAVLPLPGALVREQLQAVLADLPVEAVKTGMLATAEIVRAVAETMACYPDRPLVVDPVAIASSGYALIDDQAWECLCSELFPLAAVVTPNLPEAERITGIRIRSRAEAWQAGRAILRTGARAVLIKGGHWSDRPSAGDVLIQDDRCLELSQPWIATSAGHGTGCTLAAAIAAGLAKGGDLEQSVRTAKDYVSAALREATAIGRGVHPLNHLAGVSSVWDLGRE